MPRAPHLSARTAAESGQLATLFTCCKCPERLTSAPARTDAGPRLIGASRLNDIAFPPVKTHLRQNGATRSLLSKVIPRHDFNIVYRVQGASVRDGRRAKPSPIPF